MKKLTAILALLVAFTASAFRVDTVSVATKYLDTPMKAVVIVPDAASPSSRVPSVYILNGFGGDYKSWVSSAPRLGDFADQFGMILVMPDGRDSWYWDSPQNPGMQMESAITRDVVPYIDSHYPTLDIPARRAITGLSMGGHGAFWLGSRNPHLFGAIGSMSGGVDIVPFPKSWKMADQLGPYDANKERWQNHSVMSCIPALKANGQKITFDCGVDDFFATVNNNLHQRLVEEKIPHDYTSRPGNHSWNYWRNSIIYHLTFFNEAFNSKP